jgi:hypothetical protein
MVMRYPTELDDAPTEIVKVIGDLCGLIFYTAMVGLLIYAVMLH